MRTVLFLAYLFPPRGGAGVQRALKFVKYLPQCDWRPLVVASADPAADLATTARDATLLNDLPSQAVIRYTSVLPTERVHYTLAQHRLARRLSPTDSMTWWIRPAVRTALELLRTTPVDAIFVTMSPFSAATAGIELKRITRLPLILDLRDPWALDETRIYPTRVHAALDWRAMQHALSNADLVIMNTPQAARAVRQTFRLSTSTSVICITNGYDRADLNGNGDGMVPPAPGDVLRIVHTGMFHSEQAGLWDDLAERRGVLNRLKFARRAINLWTRTPRYLLSAIELLLSQGRIPANKLQVVLIGEISAADRVMIRSSPARDLVQILGYRAHGQSVNWLRSADVLFLPLHTPLDGRPALIVPGKTYEYLGAGRPILAMGPVGDMRDFVRQAGGIAIDGDDVGGAADALFRLYSRKLANTPPSRLSAPNLFTRETLARQLASHLDSLPSPTNGK